MWRQDRWMTMKVIAVYWLNTSPFAIFASYFTEVMLLFCLFDLLIYLRLKLHYAVYWLRRRSVTPDCCATRVVIPLPNVNERLCPVIAITKCSFILYLMKPSKKNTVFWLFVLTVAVASQNPFFRLCQGLSEHSWNDLVYSKDSKKFICWALNQHTLPLLPKHPNSV